MPLNAPIAGTAHIMNEDIKRLIPQRNPILMVDSLLSAEEGVATTAFTVKDGDMLTTEGQLMEVGLIEHIAQSASAFEGYKALLNGATEPPEGMIGEVKKFTCYRQPKVGECLHTTITMGVNCGDVTIITAETRVGDELVADTMMKIAM